MSPLEPAGRTGYHQPVNQDNYNLSKNYPKEILLWKVKGRQYKFMIIKMGSEFGGLEYYKNGPTVA